MRFALFAFEGRMSAGTQYSRLLGNRIGRHCELSGNRCLHVWRADYSCEIVNPSRLLH